MSHLAPITDAWTHHTGYVIFTVACPGCGETHTVRAGPPDENTRYHCTRGAGVYQARPPALVAPALS